MKRKFSKVKEEADLEKQGAFGKGKRCLVDNGKE